ncbi:hypothetical protein FGO68_gene7681 [Halteria grandinella]|uniref:Uncharacterized protein n=1 Tax=Halteria grandinella TaxID=5974 RepID=A0A8J8SXX4_HALGN|nr:hypothetical protein FGO68_gene7681 [Halteria grandinella]
MLSQQYNGDQFKQEFRAKFREGWQSMPLLVCLIVSVKTSLYVSSFFTSFLNQLIAPSVIFSYQLQYGALLRDPLQLTHSSMYCLSWPTT